MALFIDRLAITSADIEPLSRISDDYAKDGGNRTPRLTVTGLPDGTAELTVILHDPDAPLPHGFTHWVLHGLAPAETVEVSADAGRGGPNSLGETTYVGPFPPAGHGQHHYYFWVYALRRPVTGSPTREDFLAEYADDVIEQARLVATYSVD
jgi:Raf kinase inhibitor-like YbhB/YbcL family protein